MKIKTKNKMNLAQLIEWAWDNDITNKRYIRSDSNPPEYVWINGFSNVELDEDMCISKNDTFTVTKDEEITEDTILPTLIERRDFGNELAYSRYEYVRIKDIKGEHSTLFYIENDDLTLDLIWRDGKLVD